MRKKTLLFSLLSCMCVSTHVFGQYYQNFQAVYPNIETQNSTRNYTFTKSKNEKTYAFASSSLFKDSLQQALLLTKLDIDFDIQICRTYEPVTSTQPVIFTTNDIVATSSGSYIVCGNVGVSSSTRTTAFIAMFDYYLNPVWYTEYPNISTLNAIVEKNGLSTSNGLFAACGSSSEGNYSTGVVLEIDGNGTPVWQYNSMSNGKSDAIEYNDIIDIYDGQYTGMNAFAVAGNAKTTANGKDAIVTIIKRDGTQNWSMLVGLPNSPVSVNDEEAFGLVKSPKGDIIVVGHARCISNPISTVSWDNMFAFGINMNATITWSKRYNLPRSWGGVQVARKVIVANDQLEIAGHFSSNYFEPRGSSDGFKMRTDLSGIPSEFKNIGGTNDDKFFAIEQNFAQDGIITAGLSGSFTSSAAANILVPYVVESYNKETYPCQNTVDKVPYENFKITTSKLSGSNSPIKAVQGKLSEIPNKLSEKIICEKKYNSALANEMKRMEENQDTDISMDDNVNIKDDEIMITPNPSATSIRISGVPENAKFRIFNEKLGTVKTGVLTDNSVDVSDLIDGIYFVIVETNGFSISLEFAKK